MAINRSTKYPGRWLAPDATNLQGKFKNRTAPGSLDGSYIEKDWMNDIDALRQSIMNAAGTSINTLVDEIGANQAFRALLELIQGRAGMLSDSGAANAYVLTSNANSEPFAAYFDGMEVNFKAANANTGASTVNIDGLGVRSVVDFRGSALLNGAITSGTMVGLKYDSASGAFRLAVDSGLGFGQTWQNLTGSRSIGVTYTNTTGKPIQLAISVNPTTVTGDLVVGGVIVGRCLNSPDSTSTRNNLNAIVPNGATYSLSAGSLDTWAELR